MRVVSLVPSVTETLVEWGVTPVGVTRFCRHPEIESVGGTKNPDIDRILALDPDLVVVCVEENRLEDAGSIEAAGVPICVLDVRSVGDVCPALDELATTVGLAAGTRPRPAVEPRPSIGIRALVPIWRRPWMTFNGDTYGSSLLQSIGVLNVFDDAAERYFELDLDEAQKLRPDLVLAPSEPYPFGERHRADLEVVAPVVFLDGQDLFWWGARTPGAISRLGELARSMGNLRNS